MQEIAGLTALSLRVVEQSEQEAQLTGQAELLGTKVLLHGTSDGLQEVQDLDRKGHHDNSNKNNNNKFDTKSKLILLRYR